MNQFDMQYNTQPDGMMGYSRPSQPPQNYYGPPRSSNQPRPNTMTNWMPFQPEPQANPMPIQVQGRWVENPTEILPKEVQMDGNLYLFPQTDFSCIYAKIWNNEGRLMTYRFLPEKIEEPKAAPQTDISSFRDTFDEFASHIEQRLNTFETRMNAALSSFQQTESAPQTKTTSKARKIEDV